MLPLMLGLIVGVNSSAVWGLLVGVLAFALNNALTRLSGRGCPLLRRRPDASTHPELSQPVVDSGIRVPSGL